MKRRIPTVALAMAMLPASGLACAQEPAKPADRTAERLRLAEVVARQGVRNPRVLEALRTVPRHAFVPPSLQSHAYANTPLPIGLGQTISQPYIVALMTELLEPKPGMRVLEIGTGSGYQAAMLAELKCEVYTIELLPELGRRAQGTLKRLGYDVHARIGDGYKGWPEKAPFDGVIVTAAPDTVPQALVEQLKPGGRMVIPVGPQGRVQVLKLLEKNDKGALVEKDVIPVRFVPMVHGREEQQPG